MLDQRFALFELVRLGGNAGSHSLDYFLVKQPLDAARTFRFGAARAQRTRTAGLGHIVLQLAPLIRHRAAGFQPVRTRTAIAITVWFVDEVLLGEQSPLGVLGSVGLGHVRLDAGLLACRHL